MTTTYTSRTRPELRDNQVAQLSELEFGLIVRMHYADGTSKMAAIQSVDVKANTAIVFTSTGPSPVEGKSMWQYCQVSLADYGVVPYEDGIWNATNWLEKAD